MRGVEESTKANAFFIHTSAAQDGKTTERKKFVNKYPKRNERVRERSNEEKTA